MRVSVIAYKDEVEVGCRTVFNLEQCKYIEAHRKKSGELVRVYDSKCLKYKKIVESHQGQSFDLETSTKRHAMHPEYAQPCRRRAGIWNCPFDSVMSSERPNESQA